MPQDRIEDVIATQARKKARALVARASGQMALEGRSLTDAQNDDEIERIARDLIRAMPPDLWLDE